MQLECTLDKWQYISQARSYINCRYVHHYTITFMSTQKNHVYLIFVFLLFLCAVKVLFIQTNLQSHFVFQTFSLPTVLTSGASLTPTGGAWLNLSSHQMSHPLTYWDYMKWALARRRRRLDAIFIDWPLLYPALADLKNCMFMGLQHCEHSKCHRFGSHAWLMLLIDRGVDLTRNSWTQVWFKG